MNQYLSRMRRCAMFVSLLLMSATGASAQTDEPIYIDPRSLLPIVGTTETLSGESLLELYPLEEGNTLVKRVHFPGTSSFRLHFSILGPQPLPSGSWSVRILNAENGQELWSLSPDSSVREFWSGEIKGSRARVVVTATAAVAGRLQVIIDKVAHLQAITTPQTEINEKLKPILRATPQIQRSGRSVARLLIQWDGKRKSEEPRSCTGFLVGNDLLITNRHCIESGSEARNTEVQFDYDKDGAEPVRVGVKELVLTSCDLDFVLLRLNSSFACRSAACDNPNERPALPLAPNATMTPGRTSLVAIQHPGGEAKQVSIEGCIADQLQMMGSSSRLTDFAHKCDTKWGSSGTPIQLMRDGGVVGPVVGLHHLAVRVDRVDEMNPRFVNRAVSIGEIIAYIRQVKPALLTELIVQ